MNVDLYHDAFVDMDIDALQSDGMVRAFEQIRKLTDWTDRGSAGREWDGVMPLFSSGESGSLFMGERLR